MIAERYRFSGEHLDAFALASHRKDAVATEVGAFEREIVTLKVIDADGNETLHTRDEGIGARASMEALAGLKTLKPGGVITADNASQVCDGASGVLVVSERALKQHCLTASWGASRLTDFAVRWQHRRAKLG